MGNTNATIRIEWTQSQMANVIVDLGFIWFDEIANYSDYHSYS